MSEIKCIVFDWGGVLIDNPVEDFAKECANKIGVKVEKLKTTYLEYAYQFERGLIEESILWDKIGKRLNIRINSENSIWYDCFKNVYSPRVEIFNLAKQLKYNGYLVALLSNTETPAMNFFDDQSYEMFDYKVFSCKEGEAKPEPELYKILLEKLGTPAEHTLFIDDKLENIETAKKLNMNAIQYLTKDDLFENLRKYNIVL
jgi:putative hydrolase of the HAD superfamily